MCRYLIVRFACQVKQIKGRNRNILEARLLGEHSQTSIIAIITTQKEKVIGGGAPTFIAENRDSLQTISMSLGKTLDASAHEIDPDTMTICPTIIGRQSLWRIR